MGLTNETGLEWFGFSGCTPSSLDLSHGLTVRTQICHLESSVFTVSVSELVDSVHSYINEYQTHISKM